MPSIALLQMSNCRSDCSILSMYAASFEGLLGLLLLPHSQMLDLGGVHKACLRPACRASSWTMTGSSLGQPLIGLPQHELPHLCTEKAILRDGPAPYPQRRNHQRGGGEAASTPMQLLA